MATPRTFSVTGSDHDWHVTAPGLELQPFLNQQQAIDTAMALAAEEEGTVAWSDDYTGPHVAHPAKAGWFSFAARAARQSPIDIHLASPPESPAL